MYSSWLGEGDILTPEQYEIRKYYKVRRAGFTMSYMAHVSRMLDEYR